MLDSIRIMAAGRKTSKDELFVGLLNEVKTYNSIVSPGNLQPKADQLLRVCQVAGWYCTSKPPSRRNLGVGGGKNALRWAAVKDLLEQVGVEVATLGLRMLSGPADFKSVGTHKPGLAANEPASERPAIGSSLSIRSIRPVSI